MRFSGQENQNVLHNPTRGVSGAMLRSRLLIVLVVVLAWAGCSRETGMSVTNRSSVVITNIVVSGTGFSERIDSLAAGAERRLSVHSRGDSGVRVAFDAGGRHIDVGEQGYFEAGGAYRVAVIVEPDLKVAVSSELEKY